MSYSEHTRKDGVPNKVDMQGSEDHEGTLIQK